MIYNENTGQTYYRTGQMITGVDGRTYYIADSVQEYDGILEGGGRYQATLDDDVAFSLPVGGGGDILMLAEVTEDITINWGDVLFYGDVVPTVGQGFYEFIFSYDPNAEKWTVGVLSKGAGE